MDIRTKHKPAAPMHLKSHQIDGRLLRTGAANFSAPGLDRDRNRRGRHSVQECVRCPIFQWGFASRREAVGLGMKGCTECLSGTDLEI
jgi:hypothetical protein